MNGKLANERMGGEKRVNLDLEKENITEGVKGIFLLVD